MCKVPVHLSAGELVSREELFVVKQNGQKVVDALSETVPVAQWPQSLMQHIDQSTHSGWCHVRRSDLNRWWSSRHCNLPGAPDFLHHAYSCYRASRLIPHLPVIVVFAGQGTGVCRMSSTAADQHQHAAVN